MLKNEPGSVASPSLAPEPSAPARQIMAAIQSAGGSLPFDQFMALALYAPHGGYYTRSSRQFGAMPASGSDFITAPELSPLFGAALAIQVRQALLAADVSDVYEFGAGSGALAEQLLDALGEACQRYLIVDLSGTLRERQQTRLQRFGARVSWLDALPDKMQGVVVGNEVLDAMPVRLLAFDGTQWFERQVACADSGNDEFIWRDRPTSLRPPRPDLAFAPGTVTEIHPQAEAFIRTLADHLERGAAFFIDYGFPEAEYYHPQRTGGTLMCHRAHLADTNPLVDVGEKDITSHVNFTGIALAAQEAGLEVIGYTSQARFLLNCGLTDLLQGADIRAIAAAQKLITEHEMGELFKVIALGKGLAPYPQFSPIGFAAGDRTHTL